MQQAAPQPLWATAPIDKKTTSVIIVFMSLPSRGPDHRVYFSQDVRSVNLDTPRKK